MSKKEGNDAKKHNGAYITVVVILCVILAALVAVATLATLGYIGGGSSEDETTELEDSETTTEDLEDDDEDEDEDEDEDNNRHQHAYQVEETETATCTDKGLLTYTCSCGDTYSVETPALGHDLGETYFDESSNLWLRACQRESCTYTVEVDSPITHTHDFIISEEIEATCTEKGSITYTCSCGDTYSVETPVLGHDLGEAYYDETAEAWVRACQREDCEHTETVSNPNTHTHEFVITSETEATCEDKGSITYTCECGEKYTVETPALGHSYGEAHYDDDSEGWVRTCLICGDSIESENPNTHVHTFEKVTIVATCVADGKETYTCSCGVSYVVVLPTDPDAHSWTKLTAYETTGLWERHCELCNTYDVVKLSDLSKDELAETVIEPTTAEELLDSVVDGAVVEVNEDITLPADTDDTTYKAGKGSGLVIHEDIDYTLILGEDVTLTSSGDYHSNSYGDSQYVATIYVCDGGSITIEGSGTVNVSSYSQYCLYVDDGGSATINGGTFDLGYHIGEIPNYDTNSAKPTYTIYNLGNLTINDGNFIAENVNSSLIMNGRQEEYVHTHEEYGTSILTINGGYFIGGKHVIKNCVDGVLTITGGEITGINWAESATADGNSTSGWVADEESAINSKDIIYDLGGTVFISGGTFGTAENPEYDVIMTVKVYVDSSSTSNVNFDSSVTITGGTFYTGATGSFTFNFDGVDNTSDSAPHESIRISEEIYETYGESLFSDYVLTQQEDGTYSVTLKVD